MKNGNTSNPVVLAAEIGCNTKMVPDTYFLPTGSFNVLDLCTIWYDGTGMKNKSKTCKTVKVHCHHPETEILECILFRFTKYYSYQQQSQDHLLTQETKSPYLWTSELGRPVTGTMSAIITNSLHYMLRKTQDDNKPSIKLLTTQVATFLYC